MPIRDFFGMFLLLFLGFFTVIYNIMHLLTKSGLKKVINLWLKGPQKNYGSYSIRTNVFNRHPLSLIMVIFCTLLVSCLIYCMYRELSVQGNCTVFYT